MIGSLVSELETSDFALIDTVSIQTGRERRFAKFLPLALSEFPYSKTLTYIPTINKNQKRFSGGLKRKQVLLFCSHVAFLFIEDLRPARRLTFLRL